MARLSHITSIPLALAAAIGATGSAEAAVKFKSVQINATSGTNAIIQSVTTSQSKTNAASTKTVPVIPLTTSSSVSIAPKLGGQTALVTSANGTATAKFTDATAGTFTASSNTSVVQSIASTRTAPIHGVAASSSYTFTYKFENVGRATLLLNYFLFDPSAVTSSRVVASLSGGSGAFVQTLTPNSSGSLVARLMSGTYSLILRSTSMDKITRAYQGVGTSTGQSSDSFSFGIAAVPEPATWMTMILGFGVIGFGMRRRKSAETFARTVSA